MIFSIVNKTIEWEMIRKQAKKTQKQLKLLERSKVNNWSKRLYKLCF